MYGEPDIVLSFIRYAYWVMSVEADVCNYCKFVFDMARFTYTSINYTRGTSLRSEVPLVFVCSKSSTCVDGYNVQLLQMIQDRCSKSRKFCAVLSQIAWRVRRSNKRRCTNIRRSSEAKHCSSLCSQSEGDEYCGDQIRLKSNKVMR